MALKKLLTDLSEGNPIDNALQAYPNHNTPSTAGGFNYGTSTTRIFDGKTFRQKSFEFGKGRTSDQPGGGFSGEPYLYSGKISADSLPDVPNPGDESLLNKIGNTVDNATDGLVRGGLITAIKRSGQDLLRIGKWVFDAPKGPAWLITQTGLQRSNPKIQEKGASAFGVNLGGNSRTYNPLGINTLAQTLVNFSGLHINRAGLLPLGPSNYGMEIGYNYRANDRKYETMVKENADDQLSGDFNTGYYKANRMLHLHLMNTDEAAREENAVPNSILAEYSGGPHSIYGIGKTTLLRYEYTTGPDSKYARLAKLGIGRASYNAGIETYNPYIITKEEGGALFNERNKLTELDKEGQRVIYKNTDFDIAGSYNLKTTGITDFRKFKNQGFTDYQKTTSNGKKFIREQRVNLGNPGNQISRGIDKDTGEMIYNVYSPQTVDQINALDIIRTKGDFTDQRFRDLIRFRIEAVDSDRPDEADTMIFRAFLDSFADNYNASHNNFKYNGRGEEFYTYNTFKRTLSFNFKIAAQSRWEMMPLYRKLNFLVSNVAPEYKVTRMRTPFIRLTIGSMIDRTPGILNSISLKWQKNYPWEIALDSPENGQDKEMMVLPHVLDVSVKFTPIHNFLPQKSITRSPFIMSHENNRALNPEQKWYKAGAAGAEYDDDTKSFKSKGDINEALNEASVEGLRKRQLEDDSLKLPNYDEALKTPETGNKEYGSSEQEQETTTGADQGGTSGNEGGGQSSTTNNSSTSDPSTAGAGAASQGTTGGSGNTGGSGDDVDNNKGTAAQRGMFNSKLQKTSNDGEKETKFTAQGKDINVIGEGEKVFSMTIGPGRFGGDACVIDFFFHNMSDGRSYVSHGIMVDGVMVDGSFAQYDYHTYGIEGMRSENQADAKYVVSKYHKLRFNKGTDSAGRQIKEDSKITGATFSEILACNGECY